MSYTLLQIRTDLRDALKDTNSANYKWTDSQLTSYINRGINALWPECYIIGSDSTQLTSSTTRRYALPADCPVDGKLQPPVRQVYIAPLGGTSAGLFMLLGGWDPLQDELALGWDVDYVAKQLILRNDYGNGRAIRMVYQKPILNLVLDTDVFGGSDSAKDAVIAFAAGEAFWQRERPAISDSAKLANLVKLQQMDHAAFDSLVRGPGGAIMPDLPLIR